jgi:cation transport ATPase
MKNEGEEIRRRFPRIVMNSIMAIIFWVISVYVPPTLKSITIPGIGTDASLLMWILTILILGIFLVRVLSDALVLGDILTDVFVRRLGVKEERSPKRAARELVYIIIIVLVVTAISPLLSTVQDYGYYFTVAATYIGLGLIIVFIYDIGRIIYKIIEEKAESVANHLAEAVQKNKNSG